MTVTRYKRPAPTADAIRDAVMGITRHTPKRASDALKAEKAASATAAKPARSKADRTARTVEEITSHALEVVGAGRAPKEPMKISPEALARARQSRPSGRRRQDDGPFHAPNMFKPYTPPPGVLPQGAKPDMAMDNALGAWADTSFTNAWSTANPWGSAFAEGIGFLGYAYLSELTQRAEYRRISERIATEMTRKWIRFTVAGEADPDTETDELDELAEDKAPDAPLQEEEEFGDIDDESGTPGDDDQADENEGPTPEEIAQRKRNDALQKKILKIEEDMKRLDVRGKFRKIAEHGGWFGRAHLYIDIKGASDSPEELLTDIGNGSDKVSQEKFEKGSLENLLVREAIWCYPVRYNSNDPLKEDWYTPTEWFVLGKQVHYSRLLTFIPREVPDILKPAYAFGGLSMSQMAKPYIDNWLRTRQAVTALIETFSVSGVYTNAQSLLQGGGEDVLARIDMFNVNRTNSGCFVLDKDTEEFFNVSTPLGSLDHLQAQSQEQMSSVSGIPLIVLLGITPTGLNASSEGELRVFYDLIHAEQENQFRDKLKRVVDFIQLNLFGEVDPAIGFEFEPLWSLDEKGEAEVRKIEADTHGIYIDSGVVSPEEVRKIAIADDDSPYNGLDPDDTPEPPAQEGIFPIKGGGKDGGGMGGGGDDRSMGAADEAIEVADGVFVMDYAFDDKQFDESKHKRDSDGKFSTTGGGGSESSAEGGEKTLADFKSKKDFIGHLLLKGTTPKEVMQAMSWPSVSMNQQAAALGMKLEKKDGKYFGVKMSAEELAEAKKLAAEKKAAKASEAVGKETDAQAQQILKNAGLSDKPKFEPATDYEDFKAKIKAHSAAKNFTAHKELMEFHPGFAAKLKDENKPKAAPASLTPEEKKKAQKSTPLSLGLLPASVKPTIAGSDQSKSVEGQIKEFNAKYAGKDGLTDEQLAKKVEDFKALVSHAENMGKGEASQKAKIEAEVKAKAAAEAKEKAEKAAKEEAERQDKKKKELEAAFAADPDLKVHYEAMEALFGGKSAGEGYLKTAAKKVVSAGLKQHMSAADAVPIIAYSGSHYAKLNAELRKGTMTVEQWKFTKSLNAGLDKMPKHVGVTYRKAPSNAVDMSAYVPGHIVEERGFTSTSKNQGTWHGDVQYTVHGKTGRDIQKLSSHPSEAEVLFKSGTRFLVKSVKGNHITLEEV